AQAMEEPPVQAARLELAHRPAIAIGKDRLRAVGRAGDLVEPACDGVDGVIPGDALESSFALLADPFQRVEQSIDAVDPVKISGHLLAEESAREGMVGVASQLHGDAAPDCHEHAARVGAVERADVLDLRRHRSSSSVPRGTPGVRSARNEYSRKRSWRAI